jgi:hypothetical protein
VLVLEGVVFVIDLRHFPGGRAELGESLAQLGAALFQLHLQTPNVAAGFPQFGFQLVVDVGQFCSQAVSDEMTAQQADDKADREATGGGNAGGYQQVCI